MNSDKNDSPCNCVLTVILPVWNEHEVIEPVVEEFLAVPELSDVRVLLVDDGSTDGSMALLDQLADRHHRCEVLHLPHGGKDRALWAAFSQVKTEWVGIMDADGQYDPHDIARMLGNFTHFGDAVWGVRTQRHDRAWRRFISKVGRFGKSLVLGECAVSDTGCGMWLARTCFVQSLGTLCSAPAGQVHCHIPEFIRAQGGRISEQPITHRDRLGGQAKYGAWNRLIPGIYSLLQARRLTRTIRLSPTLKQA